jgi:hypothetical protein
MKIAFESELMENQTHAVVMAPDIAFEVLQSQDGDALFFSIGTDHVFYLTREVTQTSTGWNKIDLNRTLPPQPGGAMATAKSFGVAQNAKTGAIDIALVITVSSADYLYLSLGNANTDDAWANGVTWTAVRFDAGQAPSPFTIADVLLMNLSGKEVIFVDILRNPADPLKLLDRYYISPGAAPQWNLHRLAADFAAGSIHSCLGNRIHDHVPGIYTLGAINGEQELIFTPQYNYFRPGHVPTPARLTLPQGGSAIAAALRADGTSNLFVAATSGLFLFTPDNQSDGATPVQIVTNDLCTGASGLAASTVAAHTAVWGIGGQGNLFYVTCPSGHESDPTAWSHPVPLVPSVEQFAFFLNLNAGNNVLFANVDGQSLIRLDQDPVTTGWRQRSILLPSTQPDDMAVYESFTTHIQITDDYGVAFPNAKMAVTATSPVSIYLNSVYHVLSPSVALNITADATGVVTIVQETGSLAATCLRVTSQDDPNVAADINPASKAIATLGTVKTGGDLTNVQVSNADGSKQPLVPSSVSSDDRDTAAKSIANFMQIAQALPTDGSRQSPTSRSVRMEGAAPLSPPAVPDAWGVSFANGHLTYYEGDEAIARLAPRSGRSKLAGSGRVSAPQDIGADIELAAGDAFRWFKNALDDVESFTVQQTEGVYYFLATVGGKVYAVALDCFEAVAHATEFVFNKIKVFLEDLVKWLGYLFQWADILRTHQVLKKALTFCANQVVAALSNLEGDVAKAFNSFQSETDNWAAIPNTTDTIGSYQSTSSGTPGAGSPQSHWAMHHTKANMSAATTSYTPPSADTSTVDQIIDDLVTAIETEIDALKKAVQQIKTDVIDQFATLTPGEAMKRIAAIVTDAILATAENIVLTSLDIIKVVVEGILEALDAPISIPILSKVYNDVTGDDLSVLDLVCLVGAIPATVIYKAVANRPPFPDDQAKALRNALEFRAGPSLPPTGIAPTAPLTARPTAPGAELAATMTIVANFVAAFGSLGIIACAIAKKDDVEADAPPPVPLALASSVFYLAYTMPDWVGWFNPPDSPKWYTQMSDLITQIEIVKTFCDNMLPLCTTEKWINKISPVFESVANLIWLAPAGGAMAASDKRASDWLSLVGNIAFDLGGCVTFLTEEKIVNNADVVAGAFTAAQIMNGGYAVLSIGTGAALLNGS